MQHPYETPSAHGSCHMRAHSTLSYSSRLFDAYSSCTRFLNRLPSSVLWQIPLVTPSCKLMGDPPGLRECNVTTMREQQADFLRQAVQNTERIVQQKLRENLVRATRHSLQPASGSLEGAPIIDRVDQLHFDFASKVESLWKKAETVINGGAALNPTLERGKSTRVRRGGRQAPDEGDKVL